MRPHESRIRELVESWPGAQRYGFGPAVRRALDNEFLALPGFIPDAFFIDAPSRNVVAFEVVDTHQVTTRKLDYYCGYWWGIDGCEWDLILVIIFVDDRPSIGIDIGDIAIQRGLAKIT